MPLVLTEADLAELLRLIHDADWRHREAASLIGWINKKKQQEAQARALAVNGRGAEAAQ
jgi:hypothetical protein